MDSRLDIACRRTLAMDPACSMKDVRTLGEEAHGVGRVAGDAAINRFDIFPLALGRADLQPGDVLREQQRQAPIERWVRG